MIINVTFDSSVNSAPSGFKPAVAAAVQFYQSQFTDPITFNIDVGYGEVGGQPLGSSVLGENVTFLSTYTYSQIRALVAAPDERERHNRHTGSVCG